MGLKVTAKSQVSPADMTPGGSKLSEKKKWKKKEKIELTNNNTFQTIAVLHIIKWKTLLLEI